MQMERKKSAWDSSRVRLRSAHEKWINQRDIFVKSSGVQANYDEAFAFHLLQQHGACTACVVPPVRVAREVSAEAPSCSRSSSSGSGLGGIVMPSAAAALPLAATDPPFGRPMAMPRLTPIKSR